MSVLVEIVLVILAGGTAAIIGVEYSRFRDQWVRDKQKREEFFAAMEAKEYADKVAEIMNDGAHFDARQPATPGSIRRAAQKEWRRKKIEAELRHARRTRMWKMVGMILGFATAFPLYVFQLRGMGADGSLIALLALLGALVGAVVGGYIGAFLFAVYERLRGDPTREL